jgi:ankyrin repeat protein
MLLAAGADPNLVNPDGKTALHLCMDMVRGLLTHPQNLPAPSGPGTGAPAAAGCPSVKRLTTLCACCARGMLCVCCAWTLHDD